MKPSRRGTSLIEMVFAVGLGMAVLAAAYSAYFGIARAGDCQKSREEITLEANNLMDRIKHDVRAASSASASGGAMTLSVHGRRIAYANKPGVGTVRQASGGRWLVRGVSGRFVKSGAGVEVRLHGEARVHRRLLRVEVDGYIAKRN